MKFSEPQEIGAIREKLNTSAGHVSVAQNTPVIIRKDKSEIKTC